MSVAIPQKRSRLREARLTLNGAKVEWPILTFCVFADHFFGFVPLKWMSLGLFFVRRYDRSANSLGLSWTDRRWIY